MDEHTRLRWVCTVLEYVRREGRWGLKDVDVLRQLCGGAREGPGGAWLVEMEPDLRRWYGAPLDGMPAEVFFDLGS